MSSRIPALEEHMKHNRTVLYLLREHEYKAQLTQDESTGRVLPGPEYCPLEGINLDSSEAFLATDWPQLRSVSEVHGFLGLAKYVRR